MKALSSTIASSTGSRSTSLLSFSSARVVIPSPRRCASASRRARAKNTSRSGRSWRATTRSAVKKTAVKDLSVGTKSGGVKGGRKEWATK